jgi:four helix bundle protein
MSQKIRNHRDLEVYQMGFDAAMRIFGATKDFPSEERYSLVDQIRRSSRAVCANIAEAWRRRRYEGSFVYRLNDSEAEAAETQVWLSRSRHRARTIRDLRQHPGEAGQDDQPSRAVGHRSTAIGFLVSM